MRITIHIDAEVSEMDYNADDEVTFMRSIERDVWYALDRETRIVVSGVLAEEDYL